MSWVTLILTAAASACLTFALTYLFIRHKPRAADLFWNQNLSEIALQESRPQTELAAAVADDVTRRKLAEENYRLVVEAAPNAIIMVDAQGKITLANAQAESVFGYSRQELIGHPVEMLIPERFHHAHPGERGNYFAHPTARAMGAGRELFGRRKDGSEVPIEIGLNPIRTSEGLFVLASIIDITKRKQAERETLQQRNELAHLSRVAMLGELSGSLAHELNQPLTAILSNAQAAQRFLARDSVDLGEIREILADIVEQDKRAGEVIHRLRQLLKKGEVQRQSLDMVEVVQEVLKLMRSDLMNHGVTVRVDSSPSLPAVQGDRVQLQQVLLNLAMNACDAMAVTEPDERKLVVQIAPDAEKSVRISTIDRGKGIPPEKVQDIFEPFYTTKSHGMGLGLSVCRTIISAHGGRLWAANNADRGASFHFTLPAAKEIPA